MGIGELNNSCPKSRSDPLLLLSHLPPCSVLMGIDEAEKITMPKRFVFILLTLFFSTPMSYAFNPSDLAKLKETGNCKGCDLSNAGLNKADLTNADLSETNLRGASLQVATLIGANLSGARLNKAILRKAILLGANMAGANMAEANMTEADMDMANLSDASIHMADLRGADLSMVNFTGSNFGGADLRETEFFGADLSGVHYTPLYNPPVETMSGVQGLDTLTINKESGSAYQSPYALSLLRETFKKAGMRLQERQVTYAIKHIELADMGLIERAFHLVLFEWTCDYGMSPGRPLRILLVLIWIFSIGYFFALCFGNGKAGIWRVWPDERIHKEPGQDNPDRIKAKGLWAFLWGLYFSLLSAFHFGWRDLNIGNWLARIHPKEFSLRTTGWVKVVSGIQSLISVYLIALWALSYFGRPFE